MSCTNCGMPKDLKEFLASLIKKDANGVYGLNITLIPVADCSTLESTASCGNPQSLEELLGQACALDSCDNPTINVFYENSLT